MAARIHGRGSRGADARLGRAGIAPDKVAIGSAPIRFQEDRLSLPERHRMGAVLIRGTVS